MAAKDLYEKDYYAIGFKSDLTIMRLAHDQFRVVTGGA